MPLHKRTPFVPQPIPHDLKPDETVFYCKITNEVFRDYEEYFERLIMCNSLVWACSVTGKINLTFEEALQSEKQAQKTILSFSPALKKALLYLVSETSRAKITDVVEDIFAYAKEHYFVDETVLGVIGNLWCHSRVTKVIPPTLQEVEQHRIEQEAKGELLPNDYLSDDSWGPPPGLFRYEVDELDPDDPSSHEVHILEEIDVKREKLALTKDKCRYLIKSTSVYDEDACIWRVRDEVAKSVGLDRISFDGGLFVGKVPVFEATPGQKKAEGRKRKKTSVASANGDSSAPKPKPKLSNGAVNGVPSKGSSASSSPMSVPVTKRKSSVGKEKEKEKPKLISPAELRQLELEKKLKEKEAHKEERKLLADFKKLWQKPKPDLEVEDLQELPIPDPVNCQIPPELFGDFVMVLEYLNSYASFLCLQDSFPQGVQFEVLERALYNTEVAGPLSDILQLLLASIFQLQEGEAADITQKEKAAVELQVDQSSDDVSLSEAVEQATAAATWSLMYQGLPLHQMTLDHLSLTELLRLHLLASGARPGEKDVKWRLQMRGGYSHKEDPGLEFRLEEPQVLKTLSNGTVFDLSVPEKLKLIQCLIHQVLSYADVRDSIDQSFDQFKETRAELRALQAAERKHEVEDNAWRTRLKADRLVPPENFMKNPSLPIANEKTKFLSEEEVERFLNKRLRDATRRREEFEDRVAQLAKRLQKEDKCLGIHPLGKDRSFRRYWLLPSVPGLFVEDNDPHIGPCCETATPHIPNVDLKDIDFVQKYSKILLENEKSNGGKKKSLKSKPASVASAEAEIHLKMHSCTGGLGECPVHSKSIKRQKWSFFWQEEQLDELIAKLSPRGHREKELRQALMEEAGLTREMVKKCPARKLNLDKENEYPEIAEKKVQPRKGSLDPNLSYPPKTPISTIMELQLRDLILEAEEKIQLGTLGSLKVKDRTVWTKAIEARGFDSQISELRWGHEKSLSLSVPQRDAEVELKRDEAAVIPDLAAAILQLEQSVEVKFLKPPLGPSPKEEDKKKKDQHQQHLRANWLVGTALTRWETSLMKSTSFSQLFIHLFTLDKSICWNRSVLNARCKICRRKGDAENMLLCDGCNKGHHAYCFKPPLDEIPKGDWLCYDCKPPVLPTRPRPQRKVVLSSASESSEEEDDDAMPVLEEQEVLNEYCLVCGKGGEVICCDGCPNLYHLSCLDPPKQRVPRGLWYCDSCKDSRKREDTPKSSATSKSHSTETESEDEEDDESEKEEEESDSDQRPAPIKVRFGHSPRKAPPPTPPSASEESEDEPELRRGTRGIKRNAAYKAASKITAATKRLLRSDSKENETTSEASSSESRSGSGGTETGPSEPERKRTRLQRMNTNQCGDSGDLDNVLLDKLVTDMMRHPDSWPFLKPVTRVDAPDYHDIVKNPMDLGTIKYKLNSMVYTCNQEFLADLHLVFDNCFKYNEPTAQVYKAGDQLLVYCKRRCEKAGLQIDDE